VPEWPRGSSSVMTTPTRLGSRRSETALYEIGSGELAGVRRGHETRATQVAGSKAAICGLIITSPAATPVVSQHMRRNWRTSDPT
jgi:hypothetical protein